MLTSALYLDTSTAITIAIHDAQLNLRFRSLAARSRFRPILGVNHLSRRFCLRFSRRNRRRWLGWIQLHGMLQ